MYYYSKVNSFSLMGVPNSENMLLSEKDLITAVEFNFLVKPINLECQANAQDQDQQQQQDQRYDMSSVELKPDHENYINGFKTPTSLDHKIPAVLKCPPAPRKQRPVPAAAVMKRRPSTTARRRVFLDVSAEIECLFPPAILADLIGGKIKKLRQGKNNDGIL